MKIINNKLKLFVIAFNGLIINKKLILYDNFLNIKFYVNKEIIIFIMNNFLI